MSNWTNITETAVRTGKNTAILDAVQSLASSRGEADPLPEMIADTVATLRAACSTGNALDTDTTKIPNSLKGLALRMLTRRLKDYLEIELSPGETAQANDDRSYVNRITDQKLRFETPDNSAGGAEMQQAGGIDTISSTNRDDYTRKGMNGL